MKKFNTKICNLRFVKLYLYNIYYLFIYTLELQVLMWRKYNHFIYACNRKSQVYFPQLIVNLYKFLNKWKKKGPNHKLSLLSKIQHYMSSNFNFIHYPWASRKKFFLIIKDLLNISIYFFLWSLHVINSDTQR